MSATSVWSPCWRLVTCRRCGDRFTCTPERDYYNSTCVSDGVCGSCLFAVAREAS